VNPELLIDIMLEDGSLDRLFQLNEGFGAVIHNYYSGTANGVSSWRSVGAEGLEEYTRWYPDEELDNLFGTDTAQEIRSVREKRSKK
jgi:hypothetical protein